MPDATPLPTFEGKRCVITGGSTGVGRATASLIASQGGRVFICGRDPRHLADAIGEVESQGGNIGGLAVDIGSSDGVTRFFAAADEWLGGGLDIAVLNAGIGSKGELASMTHEECHRVVEVNLISYITCSLEAIRRMTPGGGQIVMTGSMSAHVFDERASVYVATKAGIRGFATSLRKEANPLGIKVILIEPGTISSDMVDETTAQQENMILDQRMLRAADVARTICFTLSQPDGCDIITAQIRPHLQLI